jgi:hypothetical protein
MDKSIFKRHELKYLVSAGQREFIESEFARYMIPDEHGESTICNIYYDTPDFRLIRRSLEKPVYKEKLRLRSYGTASKDEKVFLELKKKYKGIVYKRRISLDCDEAQEILENGERLPENSQIAKEINYFLDFYGDIFPAVYLCYDRTAYFGADDPDLRITFDRNIRWRTEDIDLKVEPYGEQILERGYSLMEIKAAGSMPLWLAELLAQGGIKQTSFSKYGMAYMTMLRRSMGIRTKKVKSEVTVNV